MLGFTEVGGKGLAGGMRSGHRGHLEGKPWMLKVSCSIPAVASAWPDGPVHGVTG